MTDVITESKDVTLLEILDRVLDKGVVISGDLVISIADVDLIYLGLKVLLSSVDTMERLRGSPIVGPMQETISGIQRNRRIPVPTPIQVCTKNKPCKNIDYVNSDFSWKHTPELVWGQEPTDKMVETDYSKAFAEEIEKVQDSLPRMINVDPKNVEKGLAKLVLTLVELIRKLMEKQAMRRIESGSLADEEIERIGETLMKLEKKMQELKDIFGFKDEELNLNLGPLGNLM